MPTPTPEFSEKVQARLKAARKRKRQDAVVQVIGTIIVVLAVLALIAGIIALGGLLTLLAWNYGVVAIAAACGASVAKIGFGTAICLNLAIGVVGRIFRRAPATTQVTTKA
jgi:uncharacterized membrane-anchored protein